MSGEERLMLVAAVVVGYGLFCLWCWRHCLDRGRAAAVGDVLVAYASQTGTALELARQTRAALPGDATLLPLNQVSDSVLATARRALVVASTYGEGEPPDNAARFARRLAGDATLGHLEFAILALGDSSYGRFCGFGHSVHRGLRARGAAPLWDPVELDAREGDVTGGALARWFQQLKELGAEPRALNAAMVGEPRLPWRLQQRTLLNPGSPGEPLLHLEFVPQDGELPAWEAGDIVDIIPVNDAIRCRHYAARLGLDPDATVRIFGRDMQLADALSGRELSGLTSAAIAEAATAADWIGRLPPITSRKYSVASIPADGSLDLVVRRQRDEQGRTGLASGWLTEGIAVGDIVPLQINVNPLFRAPDPSQPLILIGNGSGIAGLRAQLRYRQQSGGGRNWLIFGERDPSADRVFAGELQAWLKNGTLESLNLAFSRCPKQPMYVQDSLYCCEGQVEEWVARGAVITVCGSRHGMAEAVDEALADILGWEELDSLDAAGRYRRDIY